MRPVIQGGSISDRGSSCIQRGLLVASIVLCAAASSWIPSSAADEPSLWVRGNVATSEGPVREGWVELGSLDDDGQVDRRAIGPDGTFAIRASPGFWRLRVGSHGFVPMAFTLAPLVDDTVVPTPTLRPDRGITIRLRESGGQPIAEGDVRVVAPLAPLWHEQAKGWQPASRAGRSDRDGRLRLPAAAGEKIRVAILADGHVYRLAEVESTAELTLAAADGPGAVRVTDAAGRPLSGFLGSVEPGSWALGTSDDEGVIALPRVDVSADVKLLLTAPEGWRQRVPWPRTETVKVRRPSPLTGRVIAEHDDAAVPEAWVWHDAFPRRAVRADGDGRYSLWPVASDPRFFSVRAAAVGYRDARARREDVPAHWPEPIRLRPVASVFGRAADPDDRPLADVRVRAVRAGAGGLIRESRTDPEGGFEIGQLPIETPVELHAVHEDLETVTLTVGSLRAFDRRGPFELVMAPAGLVTGRVIDRLERPIAESKVSLGPSTVERQGLEAGRVGTEGELELVTGPDGRFSAHVTASGLIDLEATAEGFAPWMLRGVEVDASLPNNELGDVALEPLARLAGSVVDPDRQPIADAEVFVFEVGAGRFLNELSRISGREPMAVSDVDGRFEIDDRPPRVPVTLLVRRTGYGVTIRRSVMVPSEPALEIVLSPSAMLTGRVVDADGQPVSKAAVELRRRFKGESLRPAIRTTERDGTFAFEGVSPGMVLLRASAMGMLRASAVVDLVSGDDNAIEIELSAGARLTGRVLDRDGRAIAEAFVRVEPTEVSRQDASRLSRQSFTDAEGRFAFGSLRPGRWRVEAIHDQVKVERVVDVAGEDVRQDLVLDGEGVEISGIVVDENDVGLAGVRISLMASSGGMPIDTTTAPGGRFSFTGLESGVYRLLVRTPRDVPRVPTEPLDAIVVDEGGEPPLPLVIRLGPGGTIRGRVTGLESREIPLVKVMARRSSGIERAGPTVTDGWGRFELGRLAAGRWTLTAEVPGTGKHAMARVDVTGGEVALDAELAFDGGWRLAGRVLEYGVPVVGVEVMVSSGSGGMSVHTDGLGFFRFTGLISGRYTVSVMGGFVGAAWVSTVILNADHELLIELAD